MTWCPRFKRCAKMVTIQIKKQVFHRKVSISVISFLTKFKRVLDLSRIKAGVASLLL